MAFTARTETYVDIYELTTPPYDITVTKPTGTVDGDILFCWLAWTDISWENAIVDSVPSGWALLGEDLTHDERWALYYKIASGEGASWVWSFSYDVNVRAVCSCYTGGNFDPNDPIDVVSNTGYVVGDVYCKAASMTVAAANSPLVFWAGLWAYAPRTFTKPSIPTTDWVEDDDAGSATSFFYTEVCSMIWAGSGATGVMIATMSSSTAIKHAFAVALKPSGGVTAKTSSDTGSGVDAKLTDNPLATFLKSETGAGADAKITGNPLASFPVRAETGSGVDVKGAGNPLASFPVRAETGSGVDVKGAGNPLASFARLETGSGSELSTLLASLSKSETGSGAESLPSRGYVLPETGSGLDTLLARYLQLSQSGAGSELSTLLAALTKSDSGVGTDALIGLLALLLRGDSGAAAETMPTRGFLLGQSGTGTESVIDRFLNALEVASGLDIAQGFFEKFVSDAGTCSLENSYIHYIEGLKQSHETGAGVDASTDLQALFGLHDTGAGLEAVIARALYTQEYPEGALDLAKLITATLAGHETGSGAEASVIRFVLQSSETGSGSELSALTYLFTSSDSGIGAEAITLLAAMMANDAGVGVEEVISYLRKLIDTGAGAETLALVANAIKSSDVGAGLETIYSVARRLLDSGVGLEAILGLYRTALQAGVGVDTVASFVRKVLDSGAGVEATTLVGLVGRLMKARMYTRPYFKTRLYSRPYYKTKLHISETQT